MAPASSNNAWRIGRPSTRRFHAWSADRTTSTVCEKSTALPSNHVVSFNASDVLLSATELKSTFTRLNRKRNTLAHHQFITEYISERKYIVLSIMHVHTSMPVFFFVLYISGTSDYSYRAKLWSDPFFFS